jgi:hypothetical protein
MLANTSQLKRAKTLSNLDDGNLDFIVTSELEKVPNSLLKGKVRLVFMSQRTAVIKDYPWVESLLESADEVRVVLMPVEHTSDQGKRDRIKRVGKLPELKELEFHLTAPDIESNLEAAKILYPNVRMLFAMSQKINSIYKFIQQNGRLTKPDVKEFSDECSTLHDLASTLITRTSDKKKFKTDLTSHYRDRLQDAWASLNNPDTQDEQHDTAKVFAVFLRALQTSSGARTKTPTPQSIIFREAFFGGLTQFISAYQDQFVLEFDSNIPSPLADQRLKELIDRINRDGPI